MHIIASISKTYSIVYSYAIKTTQTIQKKEASSGLDEPEGSQNYKICLEQTLSKGPQNSLIRIECVH